jgi:adenylate cyclase
VIRIISFYQGKPVNREFDTTQVTIGRRAEGAAPDLDLSPDLSASPLHARVRASGEEGWIEDLGSAAGTQVNGNEIKGEGERRLRPGDTVRVGGTVLLVQVVAEGTEPDAREARHYESLAQSLDANLPPFESADSAKLTDAERRLALFYELALQFGRENRLSSLLQLIVKRLVDIIPDARRGALLAKDRDAEDLAMVAYVSPDQPAASRTLARQAMDQLCAFIWPPPRQPASESPAKSIEEYKIRSAMYAPLVWEGRALGVVCVDNDESSGGFTTDDLKLLQAVAHHAAMALANLQLQEERRLQTEYLNNLLVLISPQVAELLKQRRSRPRLGGEFRDATILLSDLRGFTNLSASMSLDDVAEMLDGYFGRLVPAVLKYRGMVDKFVGDAILAVFGSPHRDERRHLHAVRAAVEMQSAMREVNALRAAENKRTAELGIGIHCGEVVHGLVGTPERMEFTVIGDPVNRASRYCDGAGGGEVLISPEVYQWVWKHVEVEQTSITTKHEGELAAYRVRRLKRRGE